METTPSSIPNATSPIDAFKEARTKENGPRRVLGSPDPLDLPPPGGLPVLSPVAGPRPSRAGPTTFVIASALPTPLAGAFAAKGSRGAPGDRRGRSY